MNTQKKIEAAGKKKEEGNAWFKAGKYERALRRYEKVYLRAAAKFIEYDSSFTDEEKQQSKVLEISCKLNNAACKLKLKDYKEAEKLCSKVSCIISSTFILILRWLTRGYMLNLGRDLCVQVLELDGRKFSKEF
ncbi:hypothetical protein OIU76_014382 [Salix suchowensis]|uniref:Uncharacterized protein n=1 Tax=Salix suchowensis TaxID=1278906 RepID=A0ABQ9A0Q6_9ROSI|nr:hypothetical protein OIU76_014382 [Salix suchowensis]KAJ6321297.1 hypothetical protein OIU77_011400 [Salix suchowensis]KAJ6351682.1 hypothetical protein OIU78_007559 [Salix suchowensis]